MDPRSLQGMTGPVGKAGLTGISGAATTYSTAAAGFSYAVRGKAATKAQVSGGATPTTDAYTGAAITLTANKARSVVWMVNAAGTVRVAAGPIVDLDSGGAYMDAPVFPNIDENIDCPFAYTLHKAGSTTVGTWTFGSSNWNATGLTHTVVDVIFGLPDRPQTS